MGGPPWRLAELGNPIFRRRFRRREVIAQLLRERNKEIVDGDLKRSWSVSKGARVVEVILVCAIRKINGCAGKETSKGQRSRSTH